MSNIKLDRRKLILIIIFALILLLLSIGVSYSIYTGKIKIFNRTETTIKTKELGLIYTGVEEISAPNIIPGMEFEKTFTVENISDVPVDYNIYMEKVNKFKIWKIKIELCSKEKINLCKKRIKKEYCRIILLFNKIV